MPQTAPTKSNLMAMKKSLALARLGYDLLDRKRNLMMREMMRLIDDVKSIQGDISSAFATAYASLRNANMTLGQNEVFRIAMSRDTDDDITLRRRSVMGIEIPDVKLTDDIHMPGYGFSSTNPLLDETYIDFMKVRDLVAKAAAIENSVYRLAKAIKQSQKRANALKNIVIPDLEEQIHYITGYLEEKERDEFTTLKVVKGRK
ncbi:MAG: V-type ATP synthase subunit D [Eubacteriales bacterium]|nr:V-type ATP synthase subunit D [Clostridiales bacterium]MDD7301645.1 V-type ATP synthase subunit D [Eubacteriales bacterium]MDY4434127.1 V-type ATP synthase subunit D [Candidatus Flemingibacterium sp.]